MSNDLAKFLNSRRRHKTDVAIARQVKIAKSHGLGFNDKHIKEPHRHAKHHAMDCGNPQCGLCGNPRHVRKGGAGGGGLTVQERRQMQDLEAQRDRHNNGFNNDQQD
jgi:hypothetical protein